MSDSFKSPRLGLGLSEERRIAIKQANKLKQELYAQQKKIQFSNLLERANDDLDAYIESQDNVFISGRTKPSTERSEEFDEQTRSTDTTAVNALSPDAAAFETEGDDGDGFDFFYRKSFTPSNHQASYVADATEDLEFDPEESAQETLYEHLINQLNLDSKYSSLAPETLELCKRIIALLDSNGYFKIDEAKPSSHISKNLVAYPDYDEESEQAIDELDSMFEISSTYEDRLRMRKALDDYFDADSVSKFSRRLARKEFDAIVGRKTLKPEREKAKKLLDKLKFVTNFSNPLHALFAHTPSAAEIKKAEEALKIVQSLDPPGVGARDLQESLLLRVRPDTLYADELKLIISDFFDDFYKKRIGALAEKTGISSDVLSQIYSQPFPFFPSPEELFSPSLAPTRPIRPEVVVEETEPGRWTVRLDESQQDVELNPEYRKMLFSKQVDQKTKEYLRRQLLEARAFLDALRNRNSTLLRVAKAIVDFQQDFFSDQSSTPKPLTQQQIADKLGLDSSTISRACNDKWMATPRGFLSFKALFPKAVSGEVTRVEVADAIQEIIRQENKNKPFSDVALTSVLRKRYDINVSRKTVQEHRDRLQIPNSRVRKKILQNK